MGAGVASEIGGGQGWAGELAALALVGIGCVTCCVRDVCTPFSLLYLYVYLSWCVFVNRTARK